MVGGDSGGCDARLSTPMWFERTASAGTIFLYIYFLRFRTLVRQWQAGRHGAAVVVSYLRRCCVLRGRACDL